MRDMILIMENTCRQSIKKLCLIYVILFLVQCLLAYAMGKEKLVYVYYVPSLIALCLVNRVHARRMKDVTFHGAIHRIRMLPVKRSSFMWSELIFTGVSYAMLMFVQQMVSIFLYMINDSTAASGTLGFFLYALQNKAMMFFTPHSLMHLILLLLWILSATVIFTELHMAFAFDKKIGISVVYVFLYMMLFSIITNVSIQMSTIWFVVLMICSFLTLRTIIRVRGCQS